jgi:hypothetical protein
MNTVQINFFSLSPSINLITLLIKFSLWGESQNHSEEFEIPNNNATQTIIYDFLFYRK